MMREYIVTCKTKEDLDSLYEDMETPGGNLYIPDRAIELVHRRPISRNTHYMLTEEEAALIKQDDRVLDVDLTPEEKGAVFSCDYTIVCDGEAEVDDNTTLSASTDYTVTTNFWSKSTNNSNAHRPWAKYRCRNQQTVSNWGSNGTQSIAGTVQFTSTGENVDVVIVDGIIDPGHPEFAVNEDGTGGSRVNQFNWFSLNPQVTGGSAGTYSYTNGDLGDYTVGGQQEVDNNHGTHVAGTVAGNQRGWATKANIFNISPLSSAANVVGGFVFDYVRAWHNSKDNNPITGKPNPTICNNSWGGTLTITEASVNYIIYRGQQINGPFTTQELVNYGLQAVGGNINSIPLYDTALEADITDAILDGIIMVSSSGNNSHSIDIPGGVNYDNIVNYSSNISIYYNRGEYFDGTAALCVGDIDATVVEQKSASSTTGPRVDILAPGTNVVSSVLSGGVTDARNSAYRVQKYSGTSMATPQVSGVLACIAEHWPRMTHYEAAAYVSGYAANQWSQTHLATLNDLANDGASTLNYTVLNNQSSSYTFSGSATGSNPNLSVTEGQVLVFNMSNAGNHPLYIMTANTTNTSFEVTTGTLTIDGDRNTGTITWNTRGVTPGTYYYICQFHSLMVGQIVVNPDTSTRSLQGGENKFLLYPKIRKVPNPAGATYIGAETTSQQTWPRGDNKFRPILNYAYDIDRDGTTIIGGDIDEDVYPSKMIYPRHPIWSRKLT